MAWWLCGLLCCPAVTPACRGHGSVKRKATRKPWLVQERKPRGVTGSRENGGALTQQRAPRKAPSPLALG